MAEATEPAIKQDDFLTLLKGYTPAQKLAPERDALGGRYRIAMNQPLTDLGSRFAKAYAVRDEQSPNATLYALVFENGMALRQKNIDALKDFRSTNLVALLAGGLVEISTLSEVRYVAILERPPGQPLSEWLAERRQRMSETMLVQSLLRPITDLLVAFAEMGISHNRINLKNVYIAGERITLGECISEPAGFSQDAVFETPDHALCSPWGKPDFTPTDDGYALALIALHLALGHMPFAAIPKDVLINDKLVKGSYHTLIFPWELPASMQDFYRGLVNDNSRERWTPEIIKAWLNGRKFNLIMPTLARETSRGFEFAGDIHYNRKSLAQAMFLNWDSAITLLFDNKLARWVDANLHNTAAAETITRVSAGANTDLARGERQNNDILARVIMTLDATGPVRLKTLAAMPEGFGLLLANNFLNGKQEDFQTSRQMLEIELLTFWLEQQKPSPDYASALTGRLQKARTYLRMTELGFGTERCIYDLLPALPCQSPLFIRMHIANLKDLVIALDTIAAQRAAQETCMDRHIAGFIANKLDVTKPLRIHKLDMLPQLASKNELVTLQLLMRAQQKAGKLPLKGLNYWMAFMLHPLMNNIHKRDQRGKLSKELRDIAGRGSLPELGHFMLESNIFAADIQTFQKAAAHYAARNRQIATLKNNTHLAQHSRMLGRGCAQAVAFSVCFVVIYCGLKSYFHF